MKKSKFTEEQIVFALKEHQQGTKVDVITRKLGISAATFYRWQEQFGSLSVMEVKELRLLKEENSRLKQLVAELSLDKHMLQEIVSKKL
jgi:putative transposase